MSSAGIISLPPQKSTCQFHTISIKELKEVTMFQPGNIIIDNTNGTVVPPLELDKYSAKFYESVRTIDEATGKRIEEG